MQLRNLSTSANSSNSQVSWDGEKGRNLEEKGLKGSLVALMQKKRNGIFISFFGQNIYLPLASLSGNQATVLQSTVVQPTSVVDLRRTCCDCDLSFWLFNLFLSPSVKVEMTTKIYFKVIWIFKDGRNSVSSDFSVDIYEDIFESIQHTDMEDHTHVYKQFTSSFRNVFPQFNNKDYKMTALRKYFIKVTPLHIEILP